MKEIGIHKEATSYKICILVIQLFDEKTLAEECSFRNHFPPIHSSNFQHVVLAKFLRRASSNGPSL